MSQCDGSAFQNLTMGEFFTILMNLALYIGVITLISICILLIVKFVSNFIFLKIKWLCSKKYRHYLSILKTRENYTNKQFIQDCETQRIDPFVGKVFWNFCYRYYPYKPHLDDGLDILYRTTFDAVIRDTMSISCYKGDFDYSKAQNIKDVLLLLSNEKDLGLPRFFYCMDYAILALAKAVRITAKHAVIPAIKSTVDKFA